MCTHHHTVRGGSREARSVGDRGYGQLRQARLKVGLNAASFREVVEGQKPSLAVVRN